MTQLSIFLFGSFRVTLDGEAVTGFVSDKARALLAFLAVEAERPHRRESLVGLLWPEYPERSARASLRNVLANVRQVIGDREADSPFLYIERQTIQFNIESDAQVDVTAFAEGLDLAPTSSQSHAEMIHELEAAVALYQGGFLEGFSLPDSPSFEEWALLKREQLQRQALAALGRLADHYERQGEYEQALGFAWRQVEADPYRGVAQRGLMRLLALSGQREAALAQYEAFRRLLAEEMGVAPVEETVRLYEEIQAGKLDLPPQLPTFLTKEGARHEVDRPLFVARERELAQLEAFLNAALAGQGRVIFITGGPGSGKTALMDAFARQVMETHPDLLIASGNCNAYSDVGDPYLPFRDVMAMLSGDVEAKWNAGGITRDHAQRLWAALPRVVQALLDHGPHLLDVLVPGAALLPRAIIAGQASAPWLPRLREHVNRLGTGSKDVEQSYLFQQVTNVLRTVAQEQPLLLILDDVQWADAASISLLFHLGRRLAGADSRVLIACAYRPEEVAVDRAGERHLLARVLSEFKRTFGDVWVRLGRADGTEGRRFVDAILDAGPNRLAEGFRAALFYRTEGHPLFTVELLRAMQERGDLLEDKDGCWIEGPALDWEALPARVEAVIEERIGRLDPELQEILTVASVEGETFTAQVVAQVQKMAERPLLRRLSQELERRHRLVREQEETQTERGRMSHYRFGHALFQDYVYKQLSLGERRLLHGDVAAALEKLCDGRLDEMAVQLAHHFQKADDYGRAFWYLTLAAERASRLYANDEAIEHYTRAIEVAERVSPDAVSLAKLYRGRGLVCEMLGEFDQARADHKAILQIVHAAGERHTEWRALLDLGKLWASRDYNRARDYFERALKLARRIDDPAALADSLNWMGNWHTNAEDPLRAVEYHQEALKIVEELGDRQNLANTLDLLGIAHLLGSDLAAAIRYYDRAIALCRELDDHPRLVSGLIARAGIVSELITLASIPAIALPDALRDLEEAIRIAREIDSTPDEAWAHWALGLLHTVQGRLGRAMEVVQSGLRIASEIGHREWEVGNRFALGVLYGELLAPEESLQQLEEALTLAGELRSQYWIHHVTGALAGAYYLLDELTAAQTCLEMVLSPQTPMDTIGKRYCWARRAELTLAQGDPALALDITDRLIASAPSMLPGRVITFLWKLKGETLAAMGRTEQACSLLRTAIENARAVEERFLLWRIHASLGRLYRATGCQSEAKKELATARQLIQELANTAPTGKVRNDFLERAHDRLRPSP